MKTSLTAALPYGPTTPSTARFAPILFRGEPWQAFALAAELGYDGVELHLRRAEDVDQTAILKLMADTGLGVPTLGTGMAAGQDGLTFAHHDPEIRTQAVARIKDQIRLAALLAEFIVYYNDRPHQGAELKGLSPNEYAARCQTCSSC